MVKRSPSRLRFRAAEARAFNVPPIRAGSIYGDTIQARRCVLCLHRGGAAGGRRDVCGGTGAASLDLGEDAAGLSVGEDLRQEFRQMQTGAQAAAQAETEEVREAQTEAEDDSAGRPARNPVADGAAVTLRATDADGDGGADYAARGDPDAVVPTDGATSINCMFHLAQFTDYGLLFLRIMAGANYVASGYDDFKDLDARSRDIGMSKSFTIFLAAAEIAGGVALILGVLQQVAAIGLILVMLGAISKKLFVWKTGFWGKAGPGWYYELTLISMLLVILFSDGGRYVLLP